MPINEKFLAARAAERRHRDLAHLKALAWLPLRRHGDIFIRTPVVPLTLRHQIEMRMKGNALFSRGPVLLGDVFLFLWRLHPLYRTPSFGREKWIARLDLRWFRFLRLWIALRSFRAASAHRKLTAQVRQCDLGAALAIIREFVGIAEQDETCSVASDDDAPRVFQSAAAPERHHADNIISYLMAEFRLSHDEALDFPTAIANQLYRERVLSTPDGELSVFAPSDSLL